MKSKTLNIKIPEELYESLKTLAKNMNISLAAVVRIACTEYLDNKSDKK